MIKINSANKTILEFGLNIQNTAKTPSEARLIMPISESVSLLIRGNIINKNAVITVPPINDIFEGDKISNAKLEIIINEDGVDNLFEAIETDISVIHPVSINAEITEVKQETEKSLKKTSIVAEVKTEEDEDEDDEDEEYDIDDEKEKKEDDLESDKDDTEKKDKKNLKKKIKNKEKDKTEKEDDEDEEETDIDDINESVNSGLDLSGLWAGLRKGKK